MTSGGSDDGGSKRGETKAGEARTGDARTGDARTGDAKTGGGERGTGATDGKPARPAWPEDPLLHPSSDAGWGDVTRPSPGPSFPAYTPPASAPGASPARPVEPTQARPVEPTQVRPAGTVDAGVAKPTSASPAEAIQARPTDVDPARPAVPARAAAVTPASPPSAAPALARDEPLLPASFHENDLRAAVGASPLPEPTTAAKPRKQPAPAVDPPPDRPERRPRPRHDDDDDDDLPGRPRNRKTIVVAAFSITAGLAVAGLVFLGRANSERYVLACEAERAVPQEGRAFPPWGTHGLAGEQWRPLKIAAETRCQPHETDDPLVLERLYLAMVLDQATALLTAHEVTRLDEAEALLKQALLLTRPAEAEPDKLAGERTEHHKDVERLLGDVTYWRASAKLHDAATALGDAAKQFEAAAAQHPVHVSDAAAWAGYAHKLAEQLHVGPAGATQAPAPPGPAAPAAEQVATHPAAPPGIALPVEPARGSAEEPAATVPPPPDAGVPTGGVLL